MRDADRLDGWKTIGAHFGRDRTTAIRWANERGLPVHFIPGGKTRTVYALRRELEAWAQRAESEPDGLHDPPPAPALTSAAPPTAPVRRLPSWWRWVAGAAVATAAALILIGQGQDRSPQDVMLPRDPVAARLLIQARDDWAQRSSASLNRSIRELEDVTRRAPRFAPAFADLAQAYILGREAGSLPDALAFARARAAADRARSLDPSLAAADRALGFVAYWWNQDRGEAARDFRRALRLAPNDAQTHFWYANILADNGEDAAAMREFDAARLGDPGSDQIGADYAWALWSAGRDGEARARLMAIIADDPDIAEARDCLATVLLAEGDAAGYVAQQQALAALRGEGALVAHAAALRRVLARGGARAMLQLELKDDLAEQAAAPFPDHAEAAFLASLAGDRARLLAILALADQQQEQWGSAGMVRRIAARWRSDSAVMTLLARRAAPRIEPSRTA